MLVVIADGQVAFAPTLQSYGIAIDIVHGNLHPDHTDGGTARRGTLEVLGLPVGVVIEEEVPDKVGLHFDVLEREAGEASVVVDVRGVYVLVVGLLQRSQRANDLPVGLRMRVV